MTADRSDFLGPAKTKDYRPGVPGAYLPWLDQRGWFTWLDVPRMERDPRIRFGLRIIRAPLQTVTWEVLATSQDVGKYVDRTLKKLWTRYLSLAVNVVKFGTVGGEVTWEEDADTGLIELKSLRDQHISDLTPLAFPDGEVGGVRVRGATNDSAVSIHLEAPRFWWIANEPEFGSVYGRGRLAGAWTPWMEKTGRHGALDVRRLWYVKNAFRGGKMRHPFGQTEVAPGVYKNNVDIAREIAEKVETGGIIVLPNTFDEESGHYLWEYEDPEVNGQLTDLLDYPKALDDEMLQGMEIPKEVVEAADTGSGWAGRTVPFLVFLTAEDHLVDTVVSGWNHHIIKHGVHVNFGRHHRYEIKPKSLVPAPPPEEGEGGEDGAPGGPGKPPPAEGSMPTPGAGTPASMGSPGASPGGAPSAARLSADRLRGGGWLYEGERARPEHEHPYVVRLGGGYQEPYVVQLAGKATAPKKPAAKWEPYTGKVGKRKGQQGWKNSATGKVVWTPEPPGGKKTAADEPVTGAGKEEKPDAAAASPKPAAKGAATAAGPAQIAAKIKELQGQPGAYTAAVAKELIGQIVSLKQQDVNALKKQLGVTAGGKKEEQAKKIAEAAKGVAKAAAGAAAAPKSAAAKAEAVKASKEWKSFLAEGGGGAPAPPAAPVSSPAPPAGVSPETHAEAAAAFKKGFGAADAKGLKALYSGLPAAQFVAGLEKLADTGKVVLTEDADPKLLESQGYPKLSDGSYVKVAIATGDLTAADLAKAFGGKPGASPAAPPAPAPAPEPSAKGSHLDSLKAILANPKPVNGVSPSQQVTDLLKGMTAPERVALANKLGLKNFTSATQAITDFVKGVKAPYPYFTGTDALGRKWVNGKLAAKAEEAAAVKPTKAEAPKAAKGPAPEISMAGLHSLPLDAFQAVIDLNEKLYELHQQGGEPTDEQLEAAAESALKHVAPANKIKILHALKADTTGIGLVSEGLAKFLKQKLDGTFTPAEPSTGGYSPDDVDDAFGESPFAATDTPTGALPEKGKGDAHNKPQMLNAVKFFLDSTGKTATKLLEFGGDSTLDAEAKKLATSLKTWFPNVSHYETKYALENLKTLEATTLIKPMFAKGGATNHPNPKLPEESRPSLTMPEAVAAQTYTGGSYADMNSPLRTGKLPKPPLDKKTKELQEAFKKVKPFKTPVTVSRGINLYGNDLKTFIDALKSKQGSGEEFKVDGFISTATEGIPGAFHGNVEINIKAVQGLDLLPYTHYPHEKELLLPHGSHFLVKQVKESGGKWHVLLEQVASEIAPLPGEPGYTGPAGLEGKTAKKKAPEPPPAPGTGPAPAASGPAAAAAKKKTNTILGGIGSLFGFGK